MSEYILPACLVVGALLFLWDFIPKPSRRGDLGETLERFLNDETANPAEKDALLAILATVYQHNSIRKVRALIRETDKE